MDYDDIDYDEGYNIRDIANNWLNSNMDYDETNSDSNSDIDDYRRKLYFRPYIFTRFHFGPYLLFSSLLDPI